MLQRLKRFNLFFLAINFLALLILFNVFSPSVVKAATNFDDHYGVAGFLSPAQMDLVGSRWFYQWFSAAPSDTTGTYHQVQMVRMGSSWPIADPTCSNMQQCITNIKNYLNPVVTSSGNSHTYIIGNEPNLSGQDGGYTCNSTDCSTYAKEYHATYCAIKGCVDSSLGTIAGVDPSAQIIGPSVVSWGQFSGWGRNWYQSFFNGYKTSYGTNPPIDILNVHLYDLNPNFLTSATDPNHGRYAVLDPTVVACELSSTILPTPISTTPCSTSHPDLGQGFKEWMDSYSPDGGTTHPYQGKPIWVTEFGLQDCNPSLGACAPNTDSDVTYVANTNLESLVTYFGNHTRQGDISLGHWFMFIGQDASQPNPSLPNPGINETPLFRKDGSLSSFGSWYGNDSYRDGSSAPTIFTVNTLPYQSGQSTGMSWSGNSNPSSQDTIGLYRSDESLVLAFYLVDNAYCYPLSRGSGDPLSTGSCKFTIPADVTSGTYHFKLYNNNSHTFVATSRNFPINKPSPPLVIKPNISLNKDFDADKKADIGVWHPDNYSPSYPYPQTWFIRQSSQNYAQKLDQYGEAPTDIPVPCDYDGDRGLDEAIYKPGGPVNGYNWIIRPSSGAPQIVVSFGQAGDIPVPADYDGDGKCDIAVWRPAGGHWYILQSSNGYRDEQYGEQTSDIPVPADYDGDGKADLAIYKPDGGATNGYNWVIRPSSGTPQIVKTYGHATDIPVQADYDGDGKADIAVWRPGGPADPNPQPDGGHWYILQSSTNTTRDAQYGEQSSDIPVPADYDGDGKADLAIFKPNGQPGVGYNWIVRPSSGAPQIVQSYGFGKDIPLTKRPTLNFPF